MRPAAARPLASALLLLLIIGSAPAVAQYKWKDAGGQVHVSDLPPPQDIPDQNVLQRPAGAARQAVRAPAAAPLASTPGTAASAANMPATRRPVDPELEARRKRADDDARSRARADEERGSAQRADNCQRARQQLAMLDSGQRLLRYNDRGERIVVDDALRADDAQTARQVVAADCR